MLIPFSFAIKISGHKQSPRSKNIILFLMGIKIYAETFGSGKITFFHVVFNSLSWFSGTMGILLKMVFLTILERLEH